MNDLINWINAYAFVGWALINYEELDIEHFLEISENETDEYKEMLEEFRKAKLQILEEARKE